MPESSERSEILGVLERMESRLREEVRSVHQRVDAARDSVAAQLATFGERLAATEAIRDGWFRDTWPSAQRVFEGQEARLRSLEALHGLREEVDAERADRNTALARITARLGQLERWKAWVLGAFFAASGIVGLLAGWLGSRL